MANPTDPPSGHFRAELDDGQIVESDGSTITNPETGATETAVVLRMTPRRAHTLAHVLEDWCRVALVFATLRSSETTERALAWTLEAGAATAGDPEAGRHTLRFPDMPSTSQRLAAVTVLRERETSITPVQRIAIVDAAARWLGEDSGEELARALLEAACPGRMTANFVYLALIEPPGVLA